MKKLVAVASWLGVLMLGFLMSVVIIAAMHGCTKSETPPAQGTATSTNTDIGLAVDCSLVSEKLALANQTIEMPATGRFVLESHLLTNEDQSSNPKTTFENVDGHLTRACKLLQKYGARPSCTDVFTTTYHKQWTPSEGGHIGQGSAGNLRPSVEQEMLIFNMYWTSANKPKPGTKYLMSYGDKNVVVVGGFETGPASKTFLGGAQGEVHWLLGTDSNSKIKIGRLKDQLAPLGKVVCK